MSGEEIAFRFFVSYAVASDRFEQTCDMISQIVPEPDSVVSSDDVREISESIETTQELFAEVYRDYAALVDEEISEGIMQQATRSYGWVRRWDEQASMWMAGLEHKIWRQRNSYLDQLREETESAAHRFGLRRHSEDVDDSEDDIDEEDSEVGYEDEDEEDVPEVETKEETPEEVPESEDEDSEDQEVFTAVNGGVPNAYAHVVPDRLYSEFEIEMAVKRGIELGIKMAKEQAKAEAQSVAPSESPDSPPAPEADPEPVPEAPEPTVAGTEITHTSEPKTKRNSKARDKPAKTRRFRRNKEESE